MIWYDMVKSLAQIILRLDEKLAFNWNNLVIRWEKQNLKYYSELIGRENVQLIEALKKTKVHLYAIRMNCRLVYIF